MENASPQSVAFKLPPTDINQAEESKKSAQSLDLIASQMDFDRNKCAASKI